MISKITTILTQVKAWFMSLVSSNLTDELPEGWTTIDDNNNYLLPVKKELGMRGYTYYPTHPPVKIDRNRAVTTEELAVVLGDRFKAPVVLIGTRIELMSRMKSLTNKLFNDAKTLEYYEKESTENQIIAVISEISNPVMVFNIWLRSQVRSHQIVKLDGVRLDTQTLPETVSQFFNREEHCPIGEFIHRYYAAYCQYNELMGITSYSHVDIFARQLILDYSMFYMGISEFNKIEEIFPPYTGLYTDRLWETKQKKIKTTLLKVNSF